jgi:hypothetical protein
MPVRLNIIVDETVYKRLKKQVPAKKMSSFINDAVRTKLRPDKAMLDAAYRAARKEAWRNSLSEEWAPSEAEGWPE